MCVCVCESNEIELEHGIPLEEVTLGWFRLRGIEVALGNVSRYENVQAF